MEVREPGWLMQGLGLGGLCRNAGWALSQRSPVIRALRRQVTAHRVSVTLCCHHPRPLMMPPPRPETGIKQDKRDVQGK